MSGRTINIQLYNSQVEDKLIMISALPSDFLKLSRDVYKMSNELGGGLGPESAFALFPRSETLPMSLKI